MLMMDDATMVINDDDVTSSTWLVNVSTLIFRCVASP